MTIPAFDVHGNLPPGIHEATREEIAARFGHTLARRRLVAGLLAGLALLAAAGCRCAWLDGSFITDVEASEGRPPRDFDLCWDIAGVDLAALGRIEPALDPIHPDRAAQRRRFGGDFFFVAPPAGDGLVEFFQVDRQGRRKGLILIRFGNGEGGAV